ncbi:hypothetical protein AwDysgo_08930 [Bacteroidales bacterium]|nr:hypothetical protein AwDysgo_08930 [Bacteroidales bacterium]
MSGITFVNNLKIRGSCGQTGNERIAEFLYRKVVGDFKLSGAFNFAYNKTNFLFA